jgi:hypothetical protein
LKLLGKRENEYEFLVTPLDVEYSGVLGVDLLRIMEAKVDRCTGGILIGRRRYILTGVECPERDSWQVFVTKPVDSEGRERPEVMTPRMTARNVLPTGNLLGARRPESLVRGELNPESHVICEQSNNTLTYWRHSCPSFLQGLEWFLWGV